MKKFKTLTNEYGVGFLSIVILNVIEACCFSLILLFLSYSQKYLVNSLLSQNKLNPFFTCIWLSLITSVLCVFINRRRVIKTEELISRKRDDIYSSLITAKYSYYKDKKQIIATFNQNFDSYQKFIVEDIPRAVFVYSNILIMSVGVFSINPIFLVISLVTAIIFSFTLPLMKQLESIEKSLSDESEASWSLFENIKKNRSIFVFYKGSINYLFSFKKALKNMENENQKKSLVLAKLHTVGLITNIIREFGIIIVAVTLFGDTYGIGDIISLFILTSFLNTGIVEIINSYASLQKSYVAMEKISIFKKIPKEELGSNHTNILNKEINTIRLSGISYLFDNKMINYPNIELTVGGMYQLKGTIGTGKTTLIQLIGGIRKISSGEITCDGQLLNLRQLREISCIVDQRNKLFTGSVIDNITMFSSSYDIDKIIELVKLTGLDARFDLSDEGLSEVISNKSGLSGGQKQRLTICRALYRDAPIYLLDEPFSSLDQHNTTVIKNYLEKIQGKKIMVVVDHKNTMMQENLQVINL